ncbi:MAG: IS110 family transposase [Rhodopseudomonas sp.]|uniref:IS110 family transposase n=1 Tax=Rhodopseudomonas sp. TaxID=1078 RepID=UPI0039E25A2E
MGSENKGGSTKMSKSIMACAGIDTGKHKLDVAVDHSEERLQIENTATGHRRLSSWLRRQNVGRVGIEASGGYEQPVVAKLRGDGFVVIVFQPAQVRGYAKFHGKRAKNDRIDAALIAACAAETRTVRAPPDPRLSAFATHLTLIEQITEDMARFKTRCETCRDPRLRQIWENRILEFKAVLKAEFARLVQAIRQHDDLAQRLDLIGSVNGVGLRTAVAILVRMPEIGRVSREHIASLAGLAPFDDDSGDRVGERHIKDGRGRVRHSLFAAALAASFRWNVELIALYRRLTAKGKPHKVVLVACARKMLIFVNTVVQRGTPWVEKQPA